MTQWFRFYDEALDDPKVQTLPPVLFKAWVNLLCLASRNEGKLPSPEDCAFALRETLEAFHETLKALQAAGLIDVRPAYTEPHNWRKRQFKSDTSTERVKRFRKRSKTVSETAPETEAETEKNIPSSSLRSDEDRPDQKVVPIRRKEYVFEAGAIRLNQRDFERWRSAYPHLPLEAELWSLSEWASGQANWFHAVAAALAKRERAAFERLQVAAVEPPAKSYRSF